MSLAGTVRKCLSRTTDVSFELTKSPSVSAVREALFESFRHEYVRFEGRYQETGVSFLSPPVHPWPILLLSPPSHTQIPKDALRSGIQMPVRKRKSQPLIKSTKNTTEGQTFRGLDLGEILVAFFTPIVVSFTTKNLI
jgi:hypothetical protein